MICKNCNTDNPEGSTVCSNCNQPLVRKKKSASFHKYGGLIAVFIFCAVLFVINSGILTKKYEVPVERTNHPIIYTKNNTLAVKPIKKSMSALSDYLLANPTGMEQPKIFVSKNGEGIYFLEGYDTETSAGSLFASYNGKTKIPVASKVYGNVQVSDNGKYTLFIDMSNTDNNSGSLYLYEKNKEKEKIADNVQLDSFGFSPDSNNIVYITQGDLYFQKIGSEREKIDSDVKGITNISNFMSVLYTKSGADYTNLYYWKHNKEAVMVGEKVSPNLVFTSSITDNFYFCGDSASSTSSNLYFKAKNKKAELVDSNVLSPLVWDCNYKNIIYMKNFSIDNYSSDTYLKQGKKDAKKLSTTSESTRASVKASYDFNTIVYLSDINSETGLGNLYMKKKSLFKDEDPMLISENVYDFVLSKDGKTLVYVESSNANTSYTMHLYKNKSDVVLAENVQGEHFVLTLNNKAVIYLSNYNADKDSGNLFCKSLTNLKSESVKIDTEVTKHFYARNEKQVIYTKNYNNDTGESELCLWKGSKTESIDSGVINIMFEE